MKEKAVERAKRQELVIRCCHLSENQYNLFTYLFNVQLRLGKKKIQGFVHWKLKFHVWHHQNTFAPDLKLGASSSGFASLMDNKMLRFQKSESTTLTENASQRMENGQCYKAKWVKDLNGSRKVFVRLLKTNSLHRGTFNEDVQNAVHCCCCI